ncbi:hypothetical protein HH297_00105 [Xanthomonas sp. Kuri4-3]
MFESVAAFQAAYPAYRSSIEYIRDGAATVAEVERRVAVGRQKAVASTRQRAKQAYAVKAGAR